MIARLLARSALLTAALAGVRPAVPLAQTIRGTVADSATSQPLEACKVSLIDRDQRQVARVLTDSSGRFVLRAPPAEGYTLRFERLGYRTLDSDRFSVEAGSEITLSVGLVPLAVGLPAVTVAGKATIQEVFLRDAGFYQRRSAGQGFFLDPRQVEERLPRARLFADLLRGTSGVAVLRTGSGSREAAPKLRGMPSLSRPCTMPRVFVNGSPIIISEDARQGARDLNQVVQPEMVLAVEVYRGPSEIPEQYNGPESGCGVILIWTKR